jgi:LEA14-like dessication related protein
VTSRLLSLGLAGALLATACQKPEPPRITPKEARVTAVGPNGLEILLKVEALNPNRVTLSAQSFTGKAKLDGKWDLGTVTVAKPVVLPPNVPTMIDVPMTMPWTDLQALGALAATARPVPYSVDGTVAIGGESLNVNVPFAMTGTITREQIAGAALKALPSIPGLFPPPPPQR